MSGFKFGFGFGKTHRSIFSDSSIPLDLPVNISSPTLTGSGKVGYALRGTDGSWSNYTGGLTRQWLKNGVPIAGATSPFYIPSSNDLTSIITYSVSANNSNGSSVAYSTSTSAISNAVITDTDPVPNMAIGMNMPGINDFTSGDSMYNIARRVAVVISRTVGGVTGNKTLNDIGAPLSSSTNQINLSLDGLPATDSITGVTYGTLKADYSGRLYPVTSLTGFGSVQISMPVYLETARSINGDGTHKFVLDLGFDLDSFSILRNITVLKDSTNPNLWHITVPATGGSSNWLQFLWSKVPSGGMLVNIYPDDGVLNANQVLTSEEAARYSNACSYLRYLNVRSINNDKVRGDTVTSIAYRNPGEIFKRAWGSSTVFDAEDCARASNEAGVGAWYQVSHRDSLSCVVDQAQKLASLINSNVNFVEYSNETWNSAFGQFTDMIVEGVRRGYHDPNISYSADAVPLSNPICVGLTSNMFNQVGRVGGIVGGTGTTCNVPQGSNLYVNISGLGFYIFQAQQNMFVGDDVPINYKGAPSINLTAGDCVVSGDVLYVVLQNNSGGIPVTNTSYFAVATPQNSKWTLTCGTNNSLMAKARYHATKSIETWNAFDDAFLAVGKPRPKRVTNIQQGSAILNLTQMLVWDDFYKFYEASAHAPYLGGGFAGMAQYGTNLDNKTAANTTYTGPWNLNDRAALYDTTTFPVAQDAIDFCKNKFFDPSVLEIVVNNYITQVSSHRDNVTNWYSANHPELNKQGEVWCYEQAWVGIFTGWPDQNIWKNTTSYTAGSYAQSGGSTYKALVDNSNVPVSDTGTWQPITNATVIDSFGSTKSLPRIWGLFISIMRDSRFGDWSYMWDQRWAQVMGRGYLTKFDAQTPAPTNTTSFLQSWGHRETSDGITAPAWTATIKTHSDWTTTLRTISLSSTSSSVGSAWSAIINNKTTNSVITASADDGTPMTVSGNTISATFTIPGTVNVTITETLLGAIGSPNTVVVPISVSGTLVLNTLSVSNTTPLATNSWSATISGKTLGSTITATSSDGTILTVNGTTISGTFINPGSATISLVETRAPGVNSPKTSTINITITPIAILNSLTLSNSSPVINQSWTSTINNRTVGSTLSVSTSDGTSLTITGSTISGIFSNSGNVTVTITETLTGAQGSPKTNTIVVNVNANATLVDLAITNNQAAAGTNFLTNIVGSMNGSTITASSSDGTILTVNGTNISGKFTTTGTPTITLTETLGTATNSPHVTNLSVTINSALDSDTQSYINTMNVSPNYTRQTLINNLITGLKTDGIWSKLDYLAILAAHDPQAARINALNPAQGFTETGTNHTYVTDRYYAGDGSTSFLEGSPIGFTYPSAGNKFSTSGGMTTGAYYCGIVVGGLSGSWGEPAGVICPQAGLTAIKVQLSNLNSPPPTQLSITGSSAVRHVSGTRSNSTDITKCYADGVYIGTNGNSTYSAGGRPRVGKTGGGFVSAPIMAGYFGSVFTDTDATNMHNRLYTYLHAIGAV